MTATGETTNVFAGAHYDRLAMRRRDSAWLEKQWRHPSAILLPVWKSRNLVDDTQASLVFLHPTETDSSVDQAVFLGQFNGSPCFACDLGTTEAAPVFNGRFRSLRSVGNLLGAAPAALASYAQALVQWHRRQRFCGRCGSTTHHAEAGHLRRCADADCAQVFFPRIDPAIIVLAEHEQRALLGRQPGWPDGIYSTIAGFVEPGESLEDAVRREVAEETGIHIGTVDYHSSQPWPFPASLMLGFRAIATSTEITLHDQELEDARWFSRDELAAALRGGTISAPRALSISYQLVSHWFDDGNPGQLQTLIESLASR